MAQLKLNNRAFLPKNCSVMVKRAFSMYYNLGTNMNCHRCGRPILVGSWYRRAGASGKARLYHWTCWLELLQDL